jgi:hypothetical protein
MNAVLSRLSCFIQVTELPLGISNILPAENWIYISCLGLFEKECHCLRAIWGIACSKVVAEPLLFANSHICIFIHYMYLLYFVVKSDIFSDPNLRFISRTCAF